MSLLEMSIIHVKIIIDLWIITSFTEQSIVSEHSDKD